MMFTHSMRSWARGLCLDCRRRFTSGAHRIAEGDCVLLRVKDESKTPLFTKPVQPGKTTPTQWGTISHEALIGKGARDIVVTSTGRELRVNFPTLHDYCTLTPRLVTPIYPADANLIVALLDIHASPPEGIPVDAPLEILEAGTGHGALTLHLARAIHAANPKLPSEVLVQLEAGMDKSDSQEKPTASLVADTEPESSPITNIPTDVQSPGSCVLQQWRNRRGAVVHTVDVSEKHSRHAQKIVYGFRRGMYAGNVDFHVGNVNEWIDHQCTERNEGRPGKREFLSHVILDLAASHLYIAKAASVLHIDGTLLVFNPSVTQIVACVELIRDMKLPLALDRVLETGSSMTGGRKWDVCAVKPRALVRAAKERADKMDAVMVESDTAERAESKTVLEERISDPMIKDETDSETLLQGKGQWEMKCRPKFGDRVTASGFLGVWRKMKHREV